MCGLTGFSDFARVKEPAAMERLVRRMIATLIHRGPDDDGIFVDAGAGIALGFRRLSILDLSSAGHQPMRSECGRYAIVFNGEIYNFEDVRKELARRGQSPSWRGHSDTEVFLAAVSRWGLFAALEASVGMFAFAIWDGVDRVLWLGRDRLGKKPLYYALYNGRFAFASEPKAFLSDPGFPRDVDPDAIDLYLRFGYVPSPLSIYRFAKKLPPAHCATWNPASGELKIERYWDPVALAGRGALAVGEEEAEERLEALLADAVRRRMIADVPLGAFLSGGIDSSLVAALMREGSKAPVKTFSIRFENREFNEADHAREVARHIGTEHHEETCSAAAMLDIVPVLARHMDEPFADSSAIPTFAVSRMTRQHVTVALSGDGGDELFFGYPRYGAYLNHRWLLTAPPRVRRLVAAVAERMPRRRLRRAADVLRQDDPDIYRRLVGLWSEEEIRRMTGRAVASFPAFDEAREALTGVPPETRPPVQDLVTYLPEDILTKVDRASMAVSLEARAPLLDHRVAELALQLPLRFKWRGGTSKWILRRILYKRVPVSLLERPKMGFGVPLTDWFRGPMRDEMEERLSGGELAALGLDPGPARGLWAKFKAGRSHRSDLLWSIFSLVAWSETWRRGVSTPPPSGRS
jgi:asparagine synthase (glutamine-hydrolysing)